VAKEKIKGIPVLMYHALENESQPAGAKDAGEMRYVLQTGTFQEQMEYLHKEGYQTFLFNELQKPENWLGKPVVLTFDDGHESDFTLALPILQKYGFRAEFFITTGWIGTPYFMTEEQIRGLSQSGMGIGAHGVTHRFISDLPDETIQTELSDSKATLERIIGQSITAMSYPGGRLNAKTQKKARNSGYTHICTSVPQYHKQTSDIHHINRFAITNTITLQTFSSMLHVNSIGVLRVRHALLAGAKAILGNNFYNRLRTVLLRS
jgi:peptidoglycan/xylan/chitin deacetylase (PgdA/CDA1 family)